MVSLRNLFSVLLPAIALIAFSSCQAVADPVADSQKPPSASLRRQVNEAAKGFSGMMKSAEISSVVVWDPKRKINAFCLRMTEKGSDRPRYTSLSLVKGMLVDMKLDDNRCRDKRLKYYPFPEAVSRK